MEELIKLEDVSLIRGQRTLLDAMSWTVREGEQWALMGPNGAGKTTLLNIINGYLWPSQGQVQVLGARFGETDLRDLRRRLGWVSADLIAQIAGYHGEMPALDVVMSGSEASIGLYRPIGAEVRERARQLLAWLGAESLSDRAFAVLSQGEKQRVVLARAWLANPELLILDEPASGLDLVGRETLLRGLSRLIAESENTPTLIYVTHHAEEILPWFTHVLLLAGGQTIAVGEKHQVLTDALMARAFGLPVALVWREGRPWLTLS